MAWKVSAAAAALMAGIGSTAAYATDGYFMDGYGVSQTALAGAGVAYSTDAMAIALNPAGLTHVDNQTVAGMAIFMPFRSYEASGSGPVPLVATSESSHNNWFPVPDLAYAKPLSGDTVLGIGMYGNGGMNTRYSGPVFQGLGATPLTGVDLNQAFMSVSLSKRFGNLSVGVAPTMAMQLFRANGLGSFAGYSSDPGNFTDRGYSFSYGGGVRAGMEYDVTPNLRLGVAGSTKMYMTAFDQYKGLFAGGGNFDIPASVTAGVAYNIRPSVTVMFDYKRIFYGDVAAIADASTSMTPFGSSNGPGFGWSDINVYKFAAEWRATPAWTLRAGYSYNDSPLNSRDIMFAILAPATIQHHITGGFKYRWSENMDVEASLMYAPEASISGVSPYGQPVEAKMYQVEAMMGIVYHWNGRRDLESLK